VRDANLIISEAEVREALAALIESKTHLNKVQIDLMKRAENGAPIECDFRVFFSFQEKE